MTVMLLGVGLDRLGVHRGDWLPVKQFAKEFLRTHRQNGRLRLGNTRITRKTSQ